MYRKLLLSGTILFSWINAGDQALAWKLKSTAPVFDFTKANLPKKHSAPVKPLWESGIKNEVVDTNVLKQSNWYAEAIKNIEAAEYEIKKDEKSGRYGAPNRQQQFRSSFDHNGFILQPRDEHPGWKLRLQLNGVYTGKELIARPGDQDQPSAVSNKIVFNNPLFTTEYINNAEGVRQNFILSKKPVHPSSTTRICLSAGTGWYIDRVHDKELHFAKMEDDRLSGKVTYNGLKAWDADNKELAARFTVNKRHTAFSIEVNTDGAAYPVTIDPLSSSPVNTLNGTGSSYLGNSVASAGDVNGDGYSDVIVGAPGVSGNTGAAYLYLGSPTGLSASPSATLSGTNPGDNFGNSVASAGDVNGDGLSDLIVGAYRANSNAGAVYLFLGNASGTPTASSVLIDLTANDNFGSSVACAGDVNGDGYSDVIVGAKGVSSGKGAAYLFLSNGTALPTVLPTPLTDPSDVNNDNFGCSVAGAGDVDGDGFSDVVIGASGVSSNKGAAYMYLSNHSGLPASPSTSLADPGAISNDYFGNSVSTAGDVNGDGYSDVIVGAYGTSGNNGAAYLYRGSSGGLISAVATTMNGISAGGYFGFSVSCAGDINGDGYADVFVGAQVVPPSSTGAAYLFQGSATGLPASPSSTLGGLASSSSFGNSVASMGDVNGDGYSDVIVGAPNTNTNTGAAFTYHGSPDGLSATPVTLTPAVQNHAGIGNCVASAGDVNGDGYSDVVIGAYGYDNIAVDEGCAFVFYGGPSGLPASPILTLFDAAHQAGENFGIGVSCAGDVNGDGYSDLIIGAYSYDDPGFTDAGRAYVYYGSGTGLNLTPAVLDDAQQTGAGFGYFVAAAGDVNNDGYGDVIIGAYLFDDPSSKTDAGRAYVHYGSSSGVSISIGITLDDAAQTNAHFGCCVAGAGDVNGDGYSDVIVGANGYNLSGNPRGAVFVYYGSSSGLSLSTTLTDPANISGDVFGCRLAAAGDLNGDGFSDIIVADIFYNGKGRAYVYYGASGGLPTSPSLILENNQTGSAAGDFMGYSVASAGDVNGDGYSDVIVGVPQYSGSYTQQGRVFLYYGTSGGISATPNRILADDNAANEFFGVSVAGLGDVNGDGFSDVMIGADCGSYAASGRCFVYYGNNNGGLRNNLRLYNTDNTTPIQQSNITDPNLFGAGLYAKSPLGKTKGKMVWEVKKQGFPFSGNPITNSTSYYDKQSAYTDLGLTGTELKNNIQKRGRMNKVRARVEYNKVTALTGQVYGPWRYPPGYLQGAYGMNAIPLPIGLSYFNGALQSGKMNLQWSVSNDEAVSFYQVERSGNDRDFTAIGSVASINLNNNVYDYTDNDPLAGTSWYRIRILDQSGNTSYSRVVPIKNNGNGAWLYPTLVTAGQTLRLQWKGTRNTEIGVRLLNSTGMVVMNTILNASGNSSGLAIRVPELPAGVYVFEASGAGEKILSQKIVIH